MCHIRNILPALAAVAALTASSGAVHAADCKPLALATHLKMERDGAGRPLIPVSINGTPRRFLLDTAGGVAHISRTVADELKLRRDESQLRSYDINGNVSNRRAWIDKFALEGLKGTNVQMQIDEAPTEGIDGTLSQALYMDYDMDLDFGPDHFAYFSQDHCPGQVVYWKAAAVAVVPFRKKGLDISLTVTVDGKEMEAILDTGAAGTFMHMETARRVFGITPDSPELVQDGFVNGDPKLPVYSRTFSTLALEGITIGKPRFGIASDRMGQKDPNDLVSGNSRVERISDFIDRPPVILGMNILRKLHIFIALKENKLYITPASPADSPSPFDAVKPAAN